MLTEEEVEKIDAYWRATNYLSVVEIYLLDNPLLRWLRSCLLLKISNLNVEKLE